MGTGGNGNTSPGAIIPYGKLLITPYNGGTEKRSRYHYEDNKIIGFNHVQLSKGGIREWLDISVMPLTAPLKGQDTIFTAAIFSHQRESAIPGYYAVELHNKIQVELTATELVGYHRYTFPAGSEPTIRFDLAAPKIEGRAHETFIQKENDSTLVGYRALGEGDSRKLYFAAKTSKRILEFRLKGEMDIEAGDINIGLKSSERGEEVTSQLIFNPTSIPETIELKVALSLNSTEDALKNLEQLPHWNFNSVKAQASAHWEDELGKIQISSSDTNLKRIFYTALYHTAIVPQRGSSERGNRILPSTNIDSTKLEFPSATNRMPSHRLLDSMFRDSPEGYLGEASAGQMSAWAVWNILGFDYVNSPGTEYYIGSPMVERATIDVSDGKQFEIEVLNRSPENRYVRSLKLNGANYKKDHLLYTDLINGGKLIVNMGPQPSMKRADDPDDTVASEKKNIFKSIGDFFNNLFK